MGGRVIVVLPQATKSLSQNDVCVKGTASMVEQGCDTA